MSESKLYGPDGKPVVQQVTYPIGTAAVTLPGTPEELLTSAIGLNQQGQQVVNPPMLAFATWACVSAALQMQAQKIQELEERLSSLSELLETQRPLGARIN